MTKNSIVLEGENKAGRAGLWFSWGRSKEGAASPLFCHLGRVIWQDVGCVAM